MKFVESRKLKEGMVIVKPIYRGRQLLLASNHALTSDIIDNLVRNGYPGTYVYDEYSDYDDLSSLIDEELRTNLISAVEDFNIDKVVFLATDLVDSLMDKGPDFILELNNLSLFDTDTYEHSVNTALTSTTCGIGLGLSNGDLEHLAAAALLHDCGKMNVPKEILNKEGPLTDEEMKIMRRHAQYGYDLLYNNYFVHPTVRTAVLCHHENWDGSGYEKNMKGEEIPLFARIIHVADVYDALVRKRPYKKSLSQSECIEYIMGGGGTLFDYNCAATFLEYISVYPIGTDVLLSDGRTARVIKNKKGYLSRPVVVADGDVLNLPDDPKLLNITVLEAVDNEAE